MRVSLSTRFVRTIRYNLASLPIRIRISVLATGAILAVLTLLLIGSLLNDYIRPADVGADSPYGISDYSGDALAYYCTHLESIKKNPTEPWPVICQTPALLASAMIPGPAPVAHYDGDKYAWGNCTYWVALLRARAGRPIPNTWGDAYYWGWPGSE